MILGRLKWKPAEKSLLPSSNTGYVSICSSTHEKAGLITRVLFTCETLHAVLSEAVGQCFKGFYCTPHRNFWALLASAMPWLRVLLDAEDLHSVAFLGKCRASRANLNKLPNWGLYGECCVTKSLSFLHKILAAVASLTVWVNTEEAVIRDTELSGCSSFAFFIIHKFTVSVSVVNNSLYFCTAFNQRMSSPVWISMNQHPLTLLGAVLILVQCLAQCASVFCAGLGALSFYFLRSLPQYTKSRHLTLKSNSQASV